MNRLFRAVFAALFVVAAWPASAANLRIDQEPAASALGGTDIFLCEQGVGTTNTTKNCTAAQVNTYVQAQTPTASSSVLGLSKCDGTTILCGSGIMQSAATVTAGTTQTVTTAQWAGGTTFVVTTAAQTITLPVSSSLATNGGIAIQTIGQSVTLAPNAADAINGGTTGASITLPAGLTAYATTDGAGNVRVSPTSAGSGSGTVSNCTTADAIAYYAATGTTVSCLSSVGTSGQVLTSNGAGVAPTWQNASGAGITFTDGTHTVTGSTQLTVTGGTVGGTTPNATLTVTGGSGAMTLVGSTCNFNNTTTFCTFTGLTGSEYELRCYGILTGNSAHVIGMQMATSGPTWKTGSSDYNRQLISVTGASTVTNTGVAGNGMAEITQDATGNKAASFVAHIHNLSSTSVFKSAETLTSGHNGGGYFISNETNMLVATGTDTAAVVGIRYGDTDAAPANMLSGSCSLYAVAN